MSTAEESRKNLIRQIDQLLFQVGQLYVQNKINDKVIAETTARAESLAKKAESLKANLPKEGAKDEPTQVQSESVESHEQPGEVGSPQS